MNLTRNIIYSNISSNGWLDEFETLLNEIETNVETEPDITIESCKSLLELVAKNILSRLDPAHDERSANNKEAHVLLRDAKDKLFEKSVENEDALVHRFSSVVQVINEIRNERGDISHGKHLPKKVKSSTQLAKSIVAFTDGFASYLLYIFFSLDLSYQELISYEDNTAFNDILDDTYPIKGISYSKALFEQDYVAYEEALEDFLADLKSKELNAATV